MLEEIFHWQNSDCEVENLLRFRMSPWNMPLSSPLGTIKQTICDVVLFHLVFLLTFLCVCHYFTFEKSREGIGRDERTRKRRRGMASIVER